MSNAEWIVYSKNSSKVKMGALGVGGILIQNAKYSHYICTLELPLCLRHMHVSETLPLG